MTVLYCSWAISRDAPLNWNCCWSALVSVHTTTGRSRPAIPLLEGKSRGLDTGCVYGGRLTGLWWPEDALVQVDALANYRPVAEGEDEGVV